MQVQYKSEEFESGQRDSQAENDPSFSKLVNNCGLENANGISHGVNKTELILSTCILLHLTVYFSLIVVFWFGFIMFDLRSKKDKVHQEILPAQKTQPKIPC